MYQLPNLPYAFQELEPFIDTHTLGLHYHKHEQNYLDNLNEILQRNHYNYRYNLVQLLHHINEFPSSDRNNILYNLGGILNHNLYWKSMNPLPNMPDGKLKSAIELKYGSIKSFFNEFKNIALKLKGSGYTFFALKNDGQIDILNLPNQDTPLLLGYMPLFTIDMWEHAYYLNYENNKDDYLNNFFKIADFTNANRIYNSITK